MAKEIKLSRCPRCSAPHPELHPAMQAEGGEVQLCEHPWHVPTAEQIRMLEKAAAS
jgi:hypothetical protein